MTALWISSATPVFYGFLCGETQKTATLLKFIQEKKWLRLTDQFYDIICVIVFY